MDWGHDLPSQEASRSCERLFWELRGKRPQALRLADHTPEPCRAPWGSLVPGTVPPHPGHGHSLRMHSCCALCPRRALGVAPAAHLGAGPRGRREQDEDELPSCVRSPPRTGAVGRLGPPESRTRRQLRWTDTKGSLVQGKDRGARPTRGGRARGARLTRGSGSTSGACGRLSTQASRSRFSRPGLLSHCGSTRPLLDRRTLYTASPGRFLPRVPRRQRAAEKTRGPYRRLRRSPPRRPGGTEATRTTSEGAVGRGSRTKHRSPCRGRVISSWGSTGPETLCPRKATWGSVLFAKVPTAPALPSNSRPTGQLTAVTGSGGTLVPDSQSSGSPSPAPLGPWEVGFAADTEGSLPRPTSPWAEGSAPPAHLDTEPKTPLSVN